MGAFTVAVGLFTLVALVPASWADDAEPGEHLGGVLSFEDPAPLGISYEWTLTMKRKESASFVGHVGAKSWSEPSNPDGLKGWTHTSNWVAIELEQPAKLRITVERQQGVAYASGTSTLVARAELVPAVSLYSGWDDTTAAEDHVFNNSGNFWADVEFVGNDANAKGKRRVKLKTKDVLPAGKYSLVIGGNPPSLGDPTAYPPGTCDPLDAVCYAYTGRHGFRAIVETK